MTVVEPREAPAITCPPWCVVTREEHLAELSNMDGALVHWSSDRQAGEGCNVRIASTTDTGGTPDPAEPTHLFIDDDHFSDGAELGTAEQYGLGILAAVREARLSLVPPLSPGEAHDCPSWCVRWDHHADEVDDQHPPRHYGPDFGILSMEAVGNGEPAAKTYTLVSDLTVSDLRQLAADAVAAAEWLEARA